MLRSPAVQQLQALQPQWMATLEENKNTPDLGPTLDVIRDAVNGIQRSMSQAQDLLRVIVNLQVSAANQHQLALDVLDQLAKAHSRLNTHVLQRDSLPLWQIFSRREQGETPEFFGNSHARVIGIKSFVQDNSAAFLALAVLLLLSLFGAYRLSLATRGIQPADELQANALELARHWFALGIMPPLVVAFLLAPLAPLPLIGLAILLSFIPILVLLPPLIDPLFHMPLYCLAGVYVLNAVLILDYTLLRCQAGGAVPGLRHWRSRLFAYLLRSERVAEAKKRGTRHKLAVLGYRLTLAVLALAQIANLFGYFKLSQYLTALCIYSTFIGVSCIYCSSRLQFALSGRPGVAFR